MQVEGTGGGVRMALDRLRAWCARVPFGFSSARYIASTDCGGGWSGSSRSGLPSEMAVRTHSGAACAA